MSLSLPSVDTVRFPSTHRTGFSFSLTHKPTNQQPKSKSDRHHHVIFVKTSSSKTSKSSYASTSTNMILSRTMQMRVDIYFYIRQASFFSLGTSSWSLVNAIFAELPLILKQNWELASSISLAIALSNIAPFVWSALANMKNGRPLVPLHIAIAAVLSIAMAAALGFTLADISAITANTSNVPLLVLTTMSGIVGTMSVVLFFPFAYASSRVDRGWSTTLMATGTSLASLFLAVLAIIQQNHLGGGGARGPLFSMQTYFGVVSGIIGLSIMGLVGAIAVPVRDNDERIRESLGEGQQRDTDDSEPATDEEEQRQHSRSEETCTTGHCALPPTNGSETATSTVCTSVDHNLHVSNGWTLFVTTAADERFIAANMTQFSINAMAMFLPGVGPYSVAHFPNPHLALHWYTVSQLIAHTLGNVLTSAKKCTHCYATSTATTATSSSSSSSLSPHHRDRRLLALQLLVAFTLWVPIVALSVRNRGLPMHDDQAKAWIPVAINAAFSLLYGYTKVMCFHVVRSRCTADDDGEHVACVLGTINQVGAVLGSIVGYVLVQAHVFS